MTLSILDRRRIEAEFAKGLFETLRAELGEERARDILTKAVIALARRTGHSFAQKVPGGRPDLEDFVEALAAWIRMKRSTA